GIRDYKVTGVQTCALPILQTSFGSKEEALCRRSSFVCFRWHEVYLQMRLQGVAPQETISDLATDGRIRLRHRHRRARSVGLSFRSEERRVGKECGRWWPTL